MGPRKRKINEKKDQKEVVEEEGRRKIDALIEVQGRYWKEGGMSPH